MTVPEGQATINVNDVLDNDELKTILADADIRSAVFPFVNEAQADVDQLIQTEQFQQRLQLLNTAIEQDTLDFILEDLDSEKGKE